MATSFDRWEKDPFFSAAEEVQESADRMESTYRTWIHAKRDASSMWNSEELHRDLRTALGTTKWQLEEFERAVRSSYVRSSNDDAKDRHHEFVVAIENQISNVENSLQESSHLEGKASQPWVCLDEGECNELALFLSGSPASEDVNPAKIRARDNEKLQGLDKELVLDCSKNSPRSAEWGSQDTREEKSLELEKLRGHRRTASASADIGSWKIAVFDDSLVPSSSNQLPEQPVRKIPSLSGFLSSMESASKLKWSKNGFRKWKATDCHQETDTALLRPTQLTRGINACYEKSKSCLDSCDDCYDRQLYGWYGAIQRQLQRSQYQMQYSRPVQITIWIVLLLCLIVTLKKLDEVNWFNDLTLWK
ncbi:Syntaxin 6, N-terminal [Parasponia andersonii]|uniref:Syntaxin 6, N-terminal n=1 Tax=Parasponia andersonii TaxID=3476 RepID=A0A2P5BZQ7_PARAD|nr:Syntaxin 6, N-terminal [Parasponia andersonii]